MDEQHIAVKSDWQTQDMPRRKRKFVLERSFTREEMETLQRGHVPQEMEDKWFWYVEEGKLYAHRSWSGLCIFIIEFRSDNRHIVTVNRDRRQYSCRRIREDKEIINNLLDWWSKPAYDYYGEWLDETAAALRKNENK